MGSGRFENINAKKSIILKDVGKSDFNEKDIKDIDFSNDDELRDRFIRREDIVAHLHSLFIDVVNNHSDLEAVLKVLYKYRELFLYISKFPKNNFFVNRDAFIASIETIKDMERKITIKLFNNEDLDATKEVKPKYRNHIETIQMDSFKNNKEVKLIIYEILSSFETNLKLNRNEGAQNGNKQS